MGLIERKISFLCLLILFISFGDQGSDLVGFRGASADPILFVQNGTYPCNGMVGEYFSGVDLDDFDGGELLRHYAAGTRWLLAKKPTTISYGAIQNRNQGACPSDRYSNCLVPGSPAPPGCKDPFHRCKRDVA